MRPVNRACRVGEQRAVVWNRFNLSPAAASFSALGVWHGPPKALADPNPASSKRTIKTLGAPLGGRSWGMGGELAVWILGVVGDEFRMLRVRHRQMGSVSFVIILGHGMAPWVNRFCHLYD